MRLTVFTLALAPTFCAFAGVTLTNDQFTLKTDCLQYQVAGISLGSGDCNSAPVAKNKPHKGNIKGTKTKAKKPLWVNYNEGQKHKTRP